jgi:short-subunit dehydrogenase
MIERKRGHVVSVSSLSAKFSIPTAVAYTTTKFGNDGFMKALYDDLCFNGQDEFIKTTTVYPAFVQTQQKLVDVVEVLKDIPVYDVHYVAGLFYKHLVSNFKSSI